MSNSSYEAYRMSLSNYSGTMSGITGLKDSIYESGKNQIESALDLKDFDITDQLAQISDVKNSLDTASTTVGGILDTFGSASVFKNILGNMKNKLLGKTTGKTTGKTSTSESKASDSEISESTSDSTSEFKGTQADMSNTETTPEFSASDKFSENSYANQQGEITDSSEIVTDERDPAQASEASEAPESVEEAPQAVEEAPQAVEEAGSLGIDEPVQSLGGFDDDFTSFLNGAKQPNFETKYNQSDMAQQARARPSTPEPQETEEPAEAEPTEAESDPSVGENTINGRAVGSRLENQEGPEGVEFGEQTIPDEMATGDNVELSTFSKSGGLDASESGDVEGLADAGESVATDVGEGAGEIAGELAGEAVGETALEVAGTALDLSGIGSIIGVPLQILGGILSAVGIASSAIQATESSGLQQTEANNQKSAVLQEGALNIADHAKQYLGSTVAPTLSSLSSMPSNSGIF